MSANVLGYVIEVDETRPVQVNGDLGKPKVKLKLLLRNTLGKQREIWVEAPDDIVDFYSSAIPQEILDRAAETTR